MATPSQDVLAQMRSLRESIPPATKDNQDLREELLVESRKLLLSLERMDNVVERICYQLWETVVCQIAIDIRLFDILEKSKNPCSAAGLAKETKADPLFLGRILRCLASYGAIKEVGFETYSSTTVSKTFSIDSNKAAMQACLQFLSPGWLQAPAFHKQNGYKNPTDPLKTVFAMAYGKPDGAPLYEILMETPHAQALSTYMANFNECQKDWSEFYPVEDRLGKGADTHSDAVMMVDVGGGLGQQAVGLKNKFPQLPGRFVVQDLVTFPPENDRVPGIEYVVHDFMKEQPIKGARLYYLRYVPHDWPQETNVHILTQLREAMKPGYSRLIVNEWIVPHRAASSFMTALDMNMMSIGGGMERTEALHREYIEAAGLKITAIYSPGDRISESVIEAEVA